MIAATEFHKMSTFEQHRFVQKNRNNRTNLQCLKDIFGEKNVPQDATRFHTDNWNAVFIDGKSPDWSTTAKTIQLNDEKIFQLQIVGMNGTLGWEIR